MCTKTRPNDYWKEVENDFSTWTSEQREKGQSISSILIGVKTKQMALEYCLNNFKEGTSWHSKFCKHKLF